MGRHQKTARTQGELPSQPVAGRDEATIDGGDLRAELDQLRDRLHDQFTTIANHADVARERVESARAEARADLERTRDMLIGLIEQVRAEAGQQAQHHVPGSAPGPSAEARAEVIERLEHRVDALAETVTLCFDRQRDLADTMAAFLDTMLAERRDDPISGLALR